MDSTSTIFAVFLICITLCILFWVGFSSRPTTQTVTKESGKKKPLEFSKIIMLNVLITYFMGFFVGVTVVDKDPTQLSILLTYIGTPTTMSMGFYCWKAKAENCLKMQKNALDGTSLSELSSIT